MRFYNHQHQYDCGIDLHVKTMYVCILDRAGQVLVHRNLPSTPAAFIAVVAPYRDGLVVAVECMFTWYWLADVCATEAITFVLGHALAMKAIHGGKAKNDKIDSHKIAGLLRGGLLPQASVLFLRHTKDGKKLLAGIEKKHGKGKALSILAHKLGRAVFYLLSRGTVFSMETFLAASRGRERASQTSNSSHRGIELVTDRDHACAAERDGPTTMSQRSGSERV